MHLIHQKPGAEPSGQDALRSPKSGDRKMQSTTSKIFYMVGDHLIGVPELDEYRIRIRS